jgi:hypothetical protein
MTRENAVFFRVCVLYLFNMTRYPIHCVDPIMKPSHAEASVLCKVFGSLRTIFMKLVGIILDRVTLKCQLDVGAGGNSTKTTNLSLVLYVFFNQ